MIDLHVLIIIYKTKTDNSTIDFWVKASDYICSVDKPTKKRNKVNDRPNELAKESGIRM